MIRAAASRIAIVDLLFNWPPDGGARTDVKEIASRLSRDHGVCIFVPDLFHYFPRSQAVRIGNKGASYFQNCCCLTYCVHYPENLEFHRIICGL